MSKKFRVGVDLGGTNIAVGVIDENHEIIGRGKLKTNAPRPAKEIMEDIVKAVKLAVADANLTVDDIESIGIGTPGSVNKETGYIEYANNLAFDHVPAVQMLGELIDAKVYLENDANCAALGEAIAGVGKGKKLFIAITLGTGVGGGIINDGKVMAGCNEAGGELGHTVINMDGIPCNCGRVGCWEAYASASALVRQTKEAMNEHKDSKMWEIAGGSLDNVGGKTAFDAMRAGDKWGTEVVEKYIKYVAVGTVNIINIFQPEMICFGGGICNEGETLLAPLRKYVEAERYSRYCDKQTELCRAKLGNDAGIIGAALVSY
ncbi:MAG: ROK family protein [Clostridia bacterium]|nr:ROK family protein [Clostridia bacterium]